MGKRIAMTKLITDARSDGTKKGGGREGETTPLEEGGEERRAAASSALERGNGLLLDEKMKLGVAPAEAEREAERKRR